MFKNLKLYSEIAYDEDEIVPDKVKELRDMIMPFLNKLKENPRKTMLKWPNRAVEVQNFIDKINKFVDGK